MSDNREFTRHDIAVSAEVYTGDLIVAASTRNLSEQGVCLMLDQKLDEGAVIGVSLFVASDGIEDPDAEPLNVKADVVWATESDGDTSFMAGAQFKELSGEARQTLTTLVSALGDK